MEYLTQNTVKRKYKVLIVDDFPQNIQILGTILKKKGVEVGFATNGPQALKIAVSRPVDLILLDIAMPEMDGYEVCEKLKQHVKTKGIPIIFLTAKVQNDDIIKGFEVGAVDYITKPFHIAEVVSRVFTHLELKRSRDKMAKYIKIINKQNRQLDNHIKQLERLNETKDKFFSIFAHDLKNPFNALIGFAEILVNNFDDLDIYEAKEYIYYIYQTSQHGYSLLENLLDWSRSQMGRIEWEPEIIKISKIVNDTIRLLGSVASSKKIALSHSIPEQAVAYADRNMLKTVLRNLIFNSLKFTESGGNVQISSKIRKGKYPDNIQDIPMSDDIRNTHSFLEITVSDTGIGMSDEDINKLFRIDIHHSTAGTGKEKGTALGLILCKEFVERNGGEIWVCSELNKGSDFKFTLPLNAPESE